MKILPAFIALTLVLLACRPCARADDYQGADAILKQIEAQTKPTDSTTAKKQTPRGRFRADLKGFQDHAATLAPDEAARAWLALFDRALKLPASSHHSFLDDSNLAPPVTEVFEALPPPANWDALAAGIAARPSGGKASTDTPTPVLRIVAAMLQGDHAAAHRAIDALQQQETDASGSHPSGQALWDAFYALTGDRAAILKNFEAKLARWKSARDPSGDEDDPIHSDALEVPALLSLTDDARAESILREIFALDLPDVEISDKRTAALARKVALSMGSALKFAPWGLVKTLDSTDLYELLDKSFPAKKSGGRDTRQKADAYYLLGLISQGRTDDATALAVRLGNTTSHSDLDSRGELPEGALADLTTRGYAKEVYQFFGQLLKEHPGLPYWQAYISSAVLAGETDAMLAGVKAASERADLKPAVKDALRKSYGDALLAADRVDEALPILQEPDAKPAEGGEALKTRARAAARIAGIASLLGNDALVSRQLDVVADAAKTQPDIIAQVSMAWGDNLGEIFLAAKRGPEWERLLAAHLLQTVQADATRRAGRRFSDFDGDSFSSPVRDALFALVDFYTRVGRCADIVALLDDAPQWGAGNVAGLLKSKYYSRWLRRFGYQAALALHKTGHDDAALRTVNAFLVDQGGFDPAYALLLELLPAGQAEARLNELFQGDQFEERPLIWRAFLQLGQNRLDEAEKSVRQAIGIDPSDGEEPRGDRMRAYAVLGDILERKGDKEKADGMRRAVQAIRLSEDADRFHAAGLLTRAVTMYKKALGYFSDAYCIQSRLAIQLVALGKMDEAMTHYERAYELMPESFGRMESHCFGCERAFAGERAQGVAERVFNQLVAKQPENPRVHYLLGYLRGEQDREAEAAQQYREAVQLDPDYINAWKQLASTTDEPTDRDHAALNLLRLDPRRRHDSADLTRVSDLRALWPAVEAAGKFVPPEPADLYPLAASKVAQEQERQRATAAGTAPDTSGVHVRTYFRSSDEPFTPGAVIMRNKVIAEVLGFLPRNNASDDDPTP